MPETDALPERAKTTGTPPATPTWVKVFGIILLALALVVGIVMLSGGEHGPSRHMPSASVTESGEEGVHTPPVDHGGQQP